MEGITQISAIFMGINIVLILGLLYVYIKNAAKAFSTFTFGLVLFACLFLAHNVVALYFHITMMPYYVEGVELYVFILTTMQTLAFAILNWVTWR